MSPLFEKLPDDYSKKFRLRLDKKLLTFNSINHKRRGQSVLFGGSDVIFQTERSELVWALNLLGAWIGAGIYKGTGE